MVTQMEKVEKFTELLKAGMLDEYNTQHGAGGRFSSGGATGGVSSEGVAGKKVGDMTVAEKRQRRDELSKDVATSISKGSFHGATLTWEKDYAAKDGASYRANFEGGLKASRAGQKLGKDAATSSSMRGIFADGLSKQLGAKVDSRSMTASFADLHKAFGGAG